MIKQYLITIMLLLTSFSSFADDAVSAVQTKMQSKYGDCYKKFGEDMGYCVASTCVYPDLSDSKAWRAHVIRGMVNDTCYVIYYSYVGNSVVGDPMHCFYNNDRTKDVSMLYNKLFMTDSAIEAASTEDQISLLNSQVCKKGNSSANATQPATK